MNALRWDGRAGWYEAWYLIVSGRFWLRYALRVPADGTAGEATLWLAAFDGVPTAEKTTFQIDEFRTDRVGWPIEVAGATLSDDRATAERWDLQLERVPPAPFDPLPRLVRPLAKTRLLVAQPVVRIKGTVDGVSIDGELGTQAHVYGTRHADRFGWAHSPRVELLTAKSGALPELSFVARDGRARFARASLEPECWRIGGYEVRADRSSFVGVTYHDPDGTPLYCYHSERARIDGPGVAEENVSFEFASRERLAGWTVQI